MPWRALLVGLGAAVLTACAHRNPAPVPLGPRAVSLVVGSAGPSVHHVAVLGEPRRGPTVEGVGDEVVLPGGAMLVCRSSPTLLEVTLTAPAGWRPAGEVRCPNARVVASVSTVEHDGALVTVTAGSVGTYRLSSTYVPVPEGYHVPNAVVPSDAEGVVCESSEDGLRVRLERPAPPVPESGARCLLQSREGPLTVLIRTPPHESYDR